MRTLARFVLPLIPLLVACGVVACSSDGYTPKCPSPTDCMESPDGGNWVGNGGNAGQAGSGNDDAATTEDAEPDVEAEAGDDAATTD